MKSIGLHSNSVPSSVTPTPSRENNSNSALPGTSPSVILSSTNLQPSSQLKLPEPSPKAPSRSTPAPPDRQPILWVPPHLRDSLLWPRCRAILGRPSLHIDSVISKAGLAGLKTFIRSHDTKFFRSDKNVDHFLVVCV